MCGRYTLYGDTHLTERFNLATKPGFVSKDNYNVTPRQYLPIVYTNEQNQRVAEQMQWGFLPAWAKDPAKAPRPINARADHLFNSPMWRGAAMHHRCLVPARGFYEWRLNNVGQKVPYYITPKNTQLCAFAGLYSVWHDSEQRPLHTFTIITTSPNKEMSKIHDRMPVIVLPAQEAAWLNLEHREQAELAALLAPYPDNGLEIYQVSQAVNSPRYNSADLLQPVAG